MVDFYLGFLIFGVALTIATTIFGDILDGVLDGGFEIFSFDFFKPIVIVSGITVFGASGYLLTSYLSLNFLPIIIISILLGIITGILVVFVYVRPMKKVENSNSYKLSDLEGKIAEVITPIPSKGYGEVIIKIGASVVNHTAMSYDKVEIQRGEKVVVIDVIEHHVLSVGKINLQ